MTRSYGPSQQPIGGAHQGVPSPNPAPDARPNRFPGLSETTPSVKTSELIAYVVAVVAVVVTALVVGGDNGSVDPFGAAEALRYITWLTIGYMVARGLAKSGIAARDDHS